MTATDTSEHAVTLYVRADAPIPDRRREVIDRLDALRHRGELADVTIHPWPRAVSLSVLAAGDDAGILGTVRQFEEWADRTDRELRPGFERRRANSALTDESDELLVLPVLCLAAFTDDRLVGVYPSAADGTTTTVADALEELESDTPWLEATAARQQAADRSGAAGGDGDTTDGAVPLVTATAPDRSGDTGREGDRTADRSGDRSTARDRATQPDADPRSAPAASARRRFTGRLTELPGGGRS